MKTIIISDKEDGMRLDRYLRESLNLPQSVVQKYLRKGLIRLEGKKADASARVSSGQQILLKFKGEENIAVQKTAKAVSPLIAKEMRQWVLFENAKVIVLNKPAGLPVQGGSGVKDSIDARLDALRDGDERPRLVHRLDRDTSGALLLAKTRKDAASLAKLFSSRTVEKIYWALVVGVPQPYKGTIDLPLEKELSGDDKEIMQVSEEGKSAKTEYSLIERLGDSVSLVELKPLTGRTHQLRVHMASIGCPIVGDGKYGGEKAYVTGEGISTTMHLHARRLVIPSGPYKLDVTAPVGRHMKESFKALGIDPKGV